MTLKALEKDPDRRYGTPSELAADVGRYLRDEPVLARPPSRRYRARKYIRRHRLGVALASAFALLLLAFSVSMVIQVRRIAYERDRANADLLRALSKTRVPDIEWLTRQRLEIQRKVLGPENLETIFTTHQLANVLMSQGRSAEAEKLQHEALEIEQRMLGPERAEQLGDAVRYEFGGDATKRLSAVEKLHRETLETQRSLPGSENPETLRTIGELASTLVKQDHLTEAEALARELETERRVLGAEHPDALQSMGRLAAILFRRAARGGGDAAAPDPEAPAACARQDTRNGPGDGRAGKHLLQAGSPRRRADPGTNSAERHHHLTARNERSDCLGPVRTFDRRRDLQWSTGWHRGPAADLPETGAFNDEQPSWSPDAPPCFSIGASTAPTSCHGSSGSAPMEATSPRLAGTGDCGKCFLNVFLMAARSHSSSGPVGSDRMETSRSRRLGHEFRWHECHPDDAKRLPTTSEDRRPSWSPDGKTLAHPREHWRGAHPYTGNLLASDRGGKLQQLTPWNLDADFASWSPDGAHPRLRACGNGTAREA